MDKNYVFPNKEELVSHIYEVTGSDSNIRIQKSLYLLYAFYGATYGALQKDADDEQDEFEGQFYPKELFPANFEAWRYGPVDATIYAQIKQGYFLDKIKEYVPEKVTTEWSNILSFLGDLLDQISEINDFGLVDRTHQDNSWKIPYEEEKGKNHIKMNNEDIVNEYKAKYI